MTPTTLPTPPDVVSAGHPSAVTTGSPAAQWPGRSVASKQGAAAALAPAPVSQKVHAASSRHSRQAVNLPQASPVEPEDISGTPEKSRREIKKN
jgi:hypothetical protein